MWLCIRNPVSTEQVCLDPHTIEKMLLERHCFPGLCKQSRERCEDLFYSVLLLNGSLAKVSQAQRRGHTEGTEEKQSQGHQSNVTEQAARKSPSLVHVNIPQKLPAKHSGCFGPKACWFCREKGPAVDLCRHFRALCCVFRLYENTLCAAVHGASSAYT